MKSPKFTIGDQVYRATFHPLEQVWIECPECCGSGILRVILGTGEEVQIACECCKRGYEGSPGKIQIYQAIASAEPVTITGMEMRPGETIRYYHSPNYVSDEGNLFDSGHEAQARAEEKAETHRIEEAQRIERKVKSHKKWAWHVAYHRREIKRLEQSIEYHRGALAVAGKKAKV